MSISKFAPPLIDSPERPRLPGVVADLCSAGGLTDDQATWLADRWPDLPEDWASHPLLRTTREHMRAYIKRESQRALSAAATAPTTTKEPIPHA